MEQANAGLKGARDALQAALNRVERLRRSAAGERLRVVMESLNGDRPDRAPRFLQEVITAPRELEPALRAVLGEQLSTVIVDSPPLPPRDRNPQADPQRPAQLHPRVRRRHRHLHGGRAGNFGPPGRFDWRARRLRAGGRGDAWSCPAGG